MEFDPNHPQPNTLADADLMRGQLNSLKAHIDAISSILAAQVDGVTTVNPGDPATAQATIIDNVLHLTFSLPRGNDGAQGMQGIQGNPGQDGQTGGPGPQGPPFAKAVVDGVSTVNPGGNASVSVSFDGTVVHFNFAIPRGADGANGTNGIDGINGTNGSDGQTGAPGEVTNTQFAAAIAGTSMNPNGVSTLDTAFADPDAETMRQAYNALVLALKRPP